MKIIREEIIGPHVLIQADCRDVLGMFGPGSFDALVTDPPYGIGFSAQPTRYQRAAGMKAAAWDDDRPDAIVPVAIKACGCAIIWGGNYFDLRPTRGWLIWSKTGNAPSMADFEMAWTSFDMNARRFDKSVSAANQEKSLADTLHPTQKPLSLMKWSLSFLPDGAVSVLDPFMGSGTTGVACQQTGLEFFGIEREAKYFDVACRRIEEAMRQPDMFVTEARAEPEQVGMAI